MITVECTTPGCENTILSMRQIEGFKCQKCSNAIIPFQGVAHDKKLGNTCRTPFEDLRKIIDRDAARSGFTVSNIRRQEKEPAEWAKTAAGIKKLILSAFPKAETDPKQRKKAGRWVQVIQLYFQLGWTYTEVAAELNEKPNTILMITRSIAYVAEGKTAMGTVRKRSL